MVGKFLTHRINKYLKNKLQKLTYVNHEGNYTNIYLKRLADTIPISLTVFLKNKLPKFDKSVL